MRKKYAIGNWKMNTTICEGKELAQEITNNFPSNSQAHVIIAPPFTSLQAISEIIKNSSVYLAAQNVSEHEGGAYTGEVSTNMLTALGVSHVIIGHSERRALYHEDNTMVNKKTLMALEKNFTAILCIGETLEERESGSLHKVIDNQLTEGLASVSSNVINRVIIAYEPVWAIGTGKTASAKDANEVHALIRSRISQLYSKEVSNTISILYGGSVKPENAQGLITEEHIDGFLVGGACLQADSFLKIIQAVR